MTYLDRLKRKIVETSPNIEATKGSKAPYVPFVAPPPATLSRISVTPGDPELFTFSPPGDPANDDEALQERVAIMMEGNGWDEVTALREARWGADRERCWRGFLLNAQRILDAPRAQREGLLGRYRREARERYGEATAACMATSMTAWIAGRGLN